MTSFLWGRAAGLPLLVDDGSSAYLHADGLVSEIDNTDTAYHLTDVLGSVRGLIDSSGALTGTADYATFGATRSQSGASSVFGFTGEQRDPVTRFTHLRARDLNPALGRFLSVDTVQPNAPGSQGYNVYAYVANNPTTWVDPSGNVAMLFGFIVAWFSLKLAALTVVQVALLGLAVLLLIFSIIDWCGRSGNCDNLLPNGLDQAPNLSIPDLSAIPDALPNLPKPSLPSWLPWVGGAAGAGIILADEVFEKPEWVINEGSFLNWTQNMEDAWKEHAVMPTAEQLDAIVGWADKFGIDYRLDPGHSLPNPWTMPHINFTGATKNTHLPVPAGYTLP